jgi:predicted membrane protein
MSMPSWFYQPAARRISLLAASVLALLITVYPMVFMRDGVALPHSVLALTMLGISAGFVHGVGFVPEHPLWRSLFGPWLAWPLMTLGVAAMFA